MSYDVDTFLGLAAGGEPGASPEVTGAGYAVEVGDDFHVFGGGPDHPPNGHTEDYIQCPTINIGPAPDPEVQDFPYEGLAEGAFPPWTYTSPAISTFEGPSVALSALDPPPDYVTVRAVVANSGGFGDADPVTDLQGYYTACLAIEYDDNGHPLSGGGADPDSFQEPAYHMYVEFATGSADWVPDDPVAYDGFTGHGLAGYFKRTSTAYNGDPVNTASDLLFPYSEVPALKFKFGGDDIAGVGFFMAAIPDMKFIVKPYWIVPQVFACLV